MRERRGEREAWTAFIEGREEQKGNKYNVAPKDERGKYASKHEASEAAKLAALALHGKIKDLQEQVRIVLVPKNGKLRSIVYVADFVYKDMEGFTHVCDAKGYKTQVYRLKKKLAAHLLGVTIEEI